MAKKKGSTKCGCSEKQRKKMPGMCKAKAKKCRGRKK
jgi:hypothetical protein